LPAYTAAKAMVNSVSKYLSLLLAEDEILVNVISRGECRVRVNVDSGSDFHLIPIAEE
jgi:NAD(P)-dependent dehydrogenase (short-subunit alcohol dehydrogenase family)